MNTLTLHALDEALAKQLKAHARAEHKSLNQAAKELLAAALGLAPARRPNRREEFAPLCGCWTEKEARRFDEDVACFSEIDKDLWIAAHTMECGAVLITFDQHFHDIPGLRVAP
ncbi:MAG: hypothetical protein ACOYOU_04860 [Kiritimatiellia bacterium]